MIVKVGPARERLVPQKAKQRKRVVDAVHQRRTREAPAPRRLQRARRDAAHRAPVADDVRLVEDDAPPRDVEQGARRFATLGELPGDGAVGGDHDVVRQERPLVEVPPRGAVVNHAPQVRLLVHLVLPLLSHDRRAHDERPRRRPRGPNAADPFAPSSTRYRVPRGSLLVAVTPASARLPALPALALPAQRLASLVSLPSGDGVLVVAVS